MSEQPSSSLTALRSALGGFTTTDDSKEDLRKPATAWNPGASTSRGDGQTDPSSPGGLNSGIAIAGQDIPMGAVPSSSSPIKEIPSTSAGSPLSRFTELPSATQRRTKEEIERKRDEALARRRQKEKDKASIDRQRKREELAAQTLSKFGFTIAPQGISRYGTGRGDFDVKAEPAAPKTEEVPAIWEPDSRCSDEQRAVLQEVKAGRSVFFTGAAGVGKSFLLHEIERLLKYDRRNFQITATTGIAALQVSGVTIHSWSGVGLGKEPVTVLYDRIMRSKERVKIWRNTAVLVVDEISMIGADLFTKLDVLGKLIRMDRRPFGGIQLVVSGDFFQLPPVPEPRNEMRCMRCGHHNLREVPLAEACVPYEERRKDIPPDTILRCTDSVKRNGETISGCGFEWRYRRFAFETEAWAECGFKVMELTKVYRQDHPEFIATLAKIRRGICDEACTAFLETCGTELGQGGNIKIQPTNLYPIRKAVEDENRREFEKLKEEAYKFEALDDSRGGYARSVMKERLANVPPAQHLRLKKGAQVMLLANLDVKRGLVNGSRGVIVDWVDRDLVPVDDPSGINQAGAAPRRTLTGGAFGSDDWRAMAADVWADKQEAEVFPLVYFATGTQVIVRPHSWCIDIDKDNTVARTQLPLQLAWALTIHKSQGQSLDAVGVKLTTTFEKGQAYVALSRCRKPEGMKIEGFHPGVVMAHPTVSKFYECISEGKPFFITPYDYLNPLLFVQDFDPLLFNMSRIFGKPPPPLPPGSAVLAPGQKAPVPSTSRAFHEQTALVRPAPAPAPPPARAARPPAGEVGWEVLLEQAAARFLSAHRAQAGTSNQPEALSAETGEPIDASSLFTAQAFKTVTGLVQKRKAADDDDDEEEEEEGEEASDPGSSAMLGPASGGPGGFWTKESKAGALECKPKKPKRKRSKRRAGH